MSRSLPLGALEDLDDADARTVGSRTQRQSVSARTSRPERRSTVSAAVARSLIRVQTAWPPSRRGAAEAAGVHAPARGRTHEGSCRERSGLERGGVRAAALGRDVVRVQLLAAVRADEQRVGLVAARVVAQHDGRAELAVEVPVAPAHQRDDRRIEVAAGRR